MFVDGLALAGETTVTLGSTLRRYEQTATSGHGGDMRDQIDEIVATAALPLERARTLPASAYNEPMVFDLERRAVFAAGWMCIAHVSQLPETGSYLAIDLLDEPLLAVKTKDGNYNVLSRVCPHRAADILHPASERPSSGVVRRFVCPYHAWSFDLDGKLATCSQMQQAEGFVRGDWGLAQVRAELWQGFIFVNLDGQASPLAGQYADFAKAIAPWHANEMEVAIELEWECEFDWKVMVENWIESYHHMGTHQATLQRTMPASMTWTEAEHPHFIHAHLPFRESGVEQIRAALEEGTPQPGFTPVADLTLEQQSEWGVFLGYPGFMFLTMRDRLLWYRLLPLAAGRCKVQTMTLVTPAARTADDFAVVLERETAMLTEFHREDMRVNTAVQRGLQSAHAVRGRLSHLEMPVWLLQRYLASRFAAEIQSDIQ
jgi:phenylpropionate dioxygenase-like ring-hydroxylating dioxygenase large terminal subunit